MYTSNLVSKKLTYVLNMKEYFAYLKKVGLSNYTEIGVWLIEEMLSYNGVNIKGYIKDSYRDECIKYNINVDYECMKLYQPIFLHFANLHHYLDTVATVKYDKDNVMITFERVKSD